MQNKNIKIIFLPCSKWVFIVGGLILLAAVTFALILTLEVIQERPNVLSPMIIAMLFPFMFGTIFILRPFIPHRYGLSVMEIINSFLFLTVYNKEHVKYEIKIPLQDIEKFHVRIDIHSKHDMKMMGNSSTLTAAYLVMSRDKSYTEKDIEVTIVINCKNEQKYNFSYNINNLYEIKQLFSVIRFFPIFSYEVNSNLDLDTKTINNYAETGKGLGLIGWLKALFDSKDIKPAQKTVYKILIAVVIAHILFLISLFIMGYLKGTL